LSFRPLADITLPATPESRVRLAISLRSYFFLRWGWDRSLDVLSFFREPLEVGSPRRDFLPFARLFGFRRFFFFTSFFRVCFSTRLSFFSPNKRRASFLHSICRDVRYSLVSRGPLYQSLSVLGLSKFPPDLSVFLLGTSSIAVALTLARFLFRY